MSRLVASAWVTLDGVFEAETMDRWFAPYDSSARRGYIRGTVADASALLFGRKTYEVIAPYWSQLKHDELGIASKLHGLPKYVVSQQLTSVSWNNSTILRDANDAVRSLKQSVEGDIQIEGSATLVSSLMALGLIDEFRLLVHPVVMGTGRRFFTDGMPTKELNFLGVWPLELGVVALRYGAKRKYS